MKALTEAQILGLVQKSLATSITDVKVADRVYTDVLNKIVMSNNIRRFEEFAQKGSLPDAEDETIAEFLNTLKGQFGEDKVTGQLFEDYKALAVTVQTPEGDLYVAIKIIPEAEDDGTAEAPFVPFPVASPEDRELVWLFARRENIGVDEALRALFNIEQEFWATKKGQKLLREGVERSFAEFVANVPATALKESGIKRYHKDPETIALTGDAEAATENAFETAE